MSGSYLPLPEEPAEEKRRFTTVHDRYHIGNPDHGLFETATTKADGFRMAQWYADSVGVAVTCFDSMARKGAQNLWTFQPKTVTA